MKQKIKLLKRNGLAILLFMLAGFTLKAQNVVVSGALVGNGSYADMGSAFTAVNGGAQTGASIIINLVGNTTELASAVLNSGTWTSLNILPSGGAARTVSGNISGPLVDLNGATNVTINGLNTGGNALTISNTNTLNLSTSTIRFINDASNNVINNTTVLGSGTSLTLGTILFSTGVTTGNNNNAISSSTISAAGVNFPTNSIYASGTVTATNNNNNILNNSISDFFNPGLISTGINLAANNSNWNITGNKLFQTAVRTYTTANTHSGILIVGGNNYTINNNVIGYSAANATGTYSMTGTIATRFIGINVSVFAATTSTIQGNTVTAISLNTSSGATTTNGILCGINVTGGSVNIISNIIGGTVGVDLLKATPSTTQGMIVGINCSSSGTISIQTNTIGGLSSSGITATIAGGISGINISGIASNLTINGNVIGNTTSNNMRGGTSGLTTGSSIVSGINLSSTPTGTIAISNNTIQNLASYGTGTTGYVRGIWTAGVTGNTSTYSITTNSINNLSSNTGLTTMPNGQAAALGINVGVGTNGIVSSNTVTNVALTGTAATGNFAAGITGSNATGTKFLNNKIYNITNAGTSVSLTTPNIAAGVIIRSGTTDVTVANNFISLGNGQTTNTSFIGIMGNHGSTPDPIDKVYFNTINIEGTAAAGAIPSFGFLRGDLNATTRTQTVDFKNNIITNTRSGGTGLHFAIANNYGATASAIGWGLNASNNNVLNANAATVGYWTSVQNFAGWKSTSASDANSFSGITVTYVNPVNDLHLNMGVTPTVIESGGQTIAGISTDIDNENRPGPTGSVNGGGSAPDLGADEIDAVFLDVSAPIITYTALPFTCNTANRTLTATISDITGVPSTGALQPRIYFRKNAGAWFSAQGTLASGTATNGTWNFNISSATMGGLISSDVVSYYVTAQDVLANVTSNPLTGLVASDVNTVTTPPATPNTYLITGSLSGLYTVGAAGTYTTLTAAANAYNTSCLTGAVEFSLIDATYPSETYPITFLSNADASATNKLTIKPATGVAPTITGSSTVAIIVINGGDFITINGTNGTVVNSICPLVKASRNLTITNTNVSASSAIISVQTSATGNGATNNSVINTNLVGNGSLTTLVGVNIGGTNIGSGVGAVNNDNNSVTNNSIQAVQVGIYSAGQLAIKSINNQFDLNEMNGTGIASIGRIGIASFFEDQPKVRSNSIANILNTASLDAIGISLGSAGLANNLTTGTEVTNAIVTGNDIKNIVQSNTYSSGGIVIAATSTGTTLIANNMVNGVFANGTSPDFACGIYYGGGTGVLNVYHNSVHVTGATLTGASQPNIAMAINGVTPTVNMRNNIFICTGNNGFNGNTGIGLAYTSTLGNYANLTSSNNDVFVSGTSSSVGRVGSLAAGTQQTTLANWQTETGKDLNSVSINPTFVSATDLHLVANSNAGLENAGTPLPLVTTDIDCGTRNSTAPDMGADEVCTNATLATAATSNTLICAGSTVTLTATSGTLNDATTWNWYSATCGGTALGTGTVVTAIPTSTTDYFVRAEGGCVTPTLCASVTVNTNALPTLTVNSGAICTGASFTMTPSGVATYTYSNGSNIASPTSNSNYTVTGTDANGCIGNTVSSVTVNALPNVMAMTSNTLICTGSQVNLSAMGATSYTWDTGSNLTTISVSPTTTTTYTLMGTDANGCSSSTTITQNVSTCTGVNSLAEALEANYSMYPNPSNGILNVDLVAEAFEATTIEITNALGQVMLNEKLNTLHSTFNIQYFSNGVYFVKVISGNTQKTIKMVKQ